MPYRFDRPRLGWASLLMELGATLDLNPEGILIYFVKDDDGDPIELFVLENGSFQISVHAMLGLGADIDIGLIGGIVGKLEHCNWTVLGQTLNASIEGDGEIYVYNLMKGVLAEMVSAVSQIRRAHKTAPK